MHAHWPDVWNFPVGALYCACLRDTRQTSKRTRHVSSMHDRQNFMTSRLSFQYSTFDLTDAFNGDSKRVELHHMQSSPTKNSERSDAFPIVGRGAASQAAEEIAP